MRRRRAPAIECLRQRARTRRVRNGLIAIDEQVVDRRCKRPEVWIAGQSRIPAEVPRSADPFAPEAGDERSPRPARRWAERKMHVARADAADRLSQTAR